MFLSFFYFDMFLKYDLILNCLNFRTFHSRWKNLIALFLCNVFKGKKEISILFMGTVGIIVPTRQTRITSTLSEQWTKKIFFRYMPHCFNGLCK